MTFLGAGEKEAPARLLGIANRESLIDSHIGRLDRVRSPDRAEAVMLAFAPEIPREVQGVVYYYDPASISPV